MNPLLHEFTSGVNAALVDAAAEQIAEQIERAIAQRGEAFIAVANRRKRCSSGWRDFCCHGAAFTSRWSTNALCRPLIQTATRAWCAVAC